ncbi:MAG: alpha/beta hydrolase [Oscillospiraceae bacterium]|nr:alpha/beta hydrolase [Oscillospiraceae bacterium]
MPGTKANYFRTSDDAVLYFEDHCPEKGSPIVLVPGFCCSTRFFDNNIAGLSRQHRVIVFDPRGQGCSSKGLQGHTIARNCTDIRELLDHLGVEGATLLGWSMAGQFIVRYFDMFGAHRIRACGLIDCPLGAAQDEPWNAHGLKGFNMDLFNDHLKMSYTGYAGYCEFFSHLMYDGNDDSKVDWCTAELLKTPAWISFAIYSDMVMQNGYELLKKISIPMVFFGADGKVTANGKALASKWYPEAAAASPYKESYPFEHGGHVFFDCFPDEFNEKLLAFVDKVAGL